MEKVQDKKGFISSVISGIGVGVIFSLASITVFSLVLYLFNIDKSIIKPVNQFIKIISVFLGCVVGAKDNFGFIKGALIGLFTAITEYLIFAIICGEKIFGFSVFVDCAFCLVLGIIFGIVCVNVRKQ